MKVTDEFIEDKLRETGIVLFPSDLNARERRIAYESFRLGMKAVNKDDNVGEIYLADEFLPFIEIDGKRLDYDSLRSWLEVTPNIFHVDDLYNNPVARFFGSEYYTVTNWLCKTLYFGHTTTRESTKLPDWLVTFLDYCDNRDTKHDFYTNKMALEYLDAAAKKHAGL